MLLCMHFHVLLLSCGVDRRSCVRIALLLWKQRFQRSSCWVRSWKPSGWRPPYMKTCRWRSWRSVFLCTFIKSVCDVVCGEKICSAPSWNSLCQKMLCCLAGLMNSVSALHPSIGRICSITGTHVSLDTLCSSSPVSNTEVLNHFR